MKIFLIAGVSLLLLMACSSEKNQTNSSKSISETKMLIGTYTRDEGWVHGKADGVYRIVNSGDGEFIINTAAEVINPSFVAISPDKKNVYAVSELGGAPDSHGFIHAFSADEDMNLTYIDKYPTNAFSPAHVSVDATGKFVFAANYQGGVAMVYHRKEDGRLEIAQQLDHEGSGPHQNQDASHTHMVKVSPDNKYLYIPDLGSDKIWSYKIDHESGQVVKTEQEFAEVVPGSGPRHMDFHPNGSIAYIMNELNSTVSVFEFNAQDGSLAEIQVLSTLPDDFDEWNSTADIHVHPNGKYLYTSNRGHNSIASFSIDESTGKLRFIAHTSSEGEIPRNFAIHPDGDKLLVANQNSDNIAIMDLDAESGALTFSGTNLEVPTPVCIVFY